jgi:carbamoyl-phosphate synthase large subunit
MTDNIMADHIYLLPLTAESIIQILEERQIDAVLPTMGGQTALNLAIEIDKMGIWEKYGVKMIGVDVAAIELTENREAFRQHMIKIGLSVAPSFIANSFLEGKEAAQKIGFPLVIRPSYTLGGTGGAIIMQEVDFDAALRRGLNASPTHEVLVEKAVLGWKEFELELLRDQNDNVVIICTVENLDPMGIHTGDSITVAPAMTLSDTAYQQMRDEAIQAMRSLGNFSGGCNIQFAQDPITEKLIVIEINPRVSRSSALASKATGYPIAKIASKLALGYNLNELKNQITKTTSAYFEPTLDYVIVKIPRWNFDKFPGADHRLGLQMKSVGEVMGIGRNFLEALQKACQSLENGKIGLGADNKEWTNIADVLKRMEEVSDDRLFRLKDAMKLGVATQTLQNLTRIDPWFLKQIKRLLKYEISLEKYHTIQDVPASFLRELKEVGYSDLQIARLMHEEEENVRAYRKSLNIRRTYKMVDTCAAEFEAKTPYFYSTFDQENESIPSDKKKIIVLGSGPNRIGQGIEFDYCCVHGLLAIKDAGFESIMVNCNPETVSTDFDIADKLYFEPVFWEHLEEIIELEKPEGIIVQLGGQTALKLAKTFHEKGIPIIGTSYPNMDLAEDRGAFSDLLKQLGIPYPEYGAAKGVDEGIEIAKRVGYPVLVRPSYVLGGQSMRIVINDQELEDQMLHIIKNLSGDTILIDHFLDRAKEAEVDAICDGETVHIMGIMEHIEPAGVHSGDSSAVLPTYSLSVEAVTAMVEYTEKLAFALNIKGLINVQFAIKDNKVYVIEANPRASRTTPFIAKAYQVPYLQIATKVMLGTHKLKDFDIKPQPRGFAIKVPVFSFDKFPNVDKNLGPEMKSTGEEIRFIKDLSDPFFRMLNNQRNMYLSR